MNHTHSFSFHIFLLISERKGEGERERNINDERESLMGCLLHAANWGSSPQPKLVILIRIKTWALQSPG